MKVRASDVFIPWDFLPRVFTRLSQEKVQEYARLISDGHDLGAIRLWKRPDGSMWLVDGNHRLHAYKSLGIEEVPVVFEECTDELDFRKKAILYNARHGLPLTLKEKQALAKILYSAGEKRLSEIAQVLGVGRATVYRWLEDMLQQDREILLPLIQKALSEGKSYDQIEEEIGIPKQVFTHWLKNNSQIGTLDLSQMRQVKIYHLQNNLNSLTEEFRKLLDEYYMQEGVRFAGFPEWAKSKGYELDMEEWKRFADMVISALERGLVINIRKDRGFIEKYLIEELKGLGKRAREGIVKGFLGVFYEKARKDVEKIVRIVREVCEDLNVVDVKEEVRKRAKAKDNHFVKYLDLILAQYEDELSECLTKYPVLTEEEVLERKEKYLELESKEEILEELEADYPERRIPPELAERLWREKTERVYHALKEKLSRIESLEEFEKALSGLSGLERELYENSKELRAIERALREKEEKVILESLVEGIKALQWNSLDEMMQALEEKEKAVALKHVSDLKKAFSELPVPSDGEVLSLIEQGLEDGEILESFRGKGLYLERGRLLKIREEYLKKKEEERKRQEEELKRKEQELMQKQALIIAQQEVVEGRLYEEEEDLPEWVVEELLKEEEEEARGISLKGVLKELENLKKQVEDIRKEVEGLTETKAKERIGKKLDAMAQRIEKLSHRVSVSLEKKKKVDVEVARFAYRAMQEFNREYRDHTGSDLPARDFKRGMQEFCRYFAEGMKMGRPAEELMQDLFDAMSAQFEKHRNSGFKKAGVAYLTPSDLIQNLARYLAIAREEVTRQLVYERVINHYREVFGNGSI